MSWLGWLGFVHLSLASLSGSDLHCFCLAGVAASGKANSSRRVFLKEGPLRLVCCCFPFPNKRDPGFLHFEKCPPETIGRSKLQYEARAVGRRPFQEQALPVFRGCGCWKSLRGRFSVGTCTVALLHGFSKNEQLNRRMWSSPTRRVPRQP